MQSRLSDCPQSGVRKTVNKEYCSCLQKENFKGRSTAGGTGLRTMRKQRSALNLCRVLSVPLLNKRSLLLFDSGNGVKPKKQLETCRAVAHPLLVVPTGSKLKISLPSALNNTHDKSWDSASKTWRLT